MPPLIKAFFYATVLMLICCGLWDIRSGLKKLHPSVILILDGLCEMAVAWIIFHAARGRFPCP